MNTSLDIKKIYEIIDLYKYASITGERVEVVVTPYEIDGKWDDSKRVITIGLQGGTSRDRDTFVVDDADTFDRVVLPELLAYYSVDDSLGNWDITVPEVENTTAKGVAETESGNLVYLESFDNSIYEKITKEKEEVEQKTTYNKTPLTDEEKVWDEIILYAKRRRVTSDFYNGTSYTKEEKEIINNFILKAIEQEKSISISNDKKYREKNENLFEEIFKDKEKLESLGINEELASKIINLHSVKTLAHIAGNEKRIRRRLDLDNPEIQTKIDFAVSELDRVEYFNLKNASAIQFENGKFISSQPKAINSLKEIYDKDNELREDTKGVYKEYCNQILGYLEKKAKNNKKIVKTDIETPNIEFKELDDAIVDSYDKFLEALDLVRYGKLDEENYEVIIENDKDDKTKRRVRISLTNTITRGDRFNFLFTNGAEFDEKFKDTLKEIRKEDPNFLSEISLENKPSEEQTKTALHTSKQGNEILIKDANDKLAYPTSAEEVKKAEEKDIIDEDMLAKLLGLESQIIEEAKKQDNLNLKQNAQKVNSFANFDLLHEYVKKYKISNQNGYLQIFSRETKEEYIPLSDSEKRNIEFATYWAVMAGVEDSKDDIMVGEKYAFNENNKKLFDIMNVHVKNSIENNIEIDYESLKKQFISSGVKHAEEIFDRMFKNQFYMEYVTNYYTKSLNSNEFDKNDYDYIASINKEKRLEKSELKIDYYDDFNEFSDVKAAAMEQAKEIYAKNEKIDLLNGAEEQAKMLQADQEKVELLANAYKLAKELLEKRQIEEFRESAKEEAKNIQIDDEYNQILDSAKEEAQRIEKENEKADLLNGAEEQAKMLQAVQEKIEILADAYKLAKEILEKRQREEFKESAKEEAKNIQKHDEYNQILDSANKEAKKLEAQNEYVKILDSAKEEAQTIKKKNEEADLLNGAEEQAKMLMQKDDNLFEIVENKDDEEVMNPVISEICDSYEIVEAYATEEQPVSIKILFDKQNDTEAEVIISNGLGEKESIMYDRTFDNKALTETILPILCKLYARDTELNYNEAFEVPNVNKAGLVIVGTDEKTFQVSNAEKGFVNLCQQTVEKELQNNYKEEKVATR